MRIIPLFRGKVMEAAGWVKKYMEEPSSQVFSASRWWDVQFMTERFVRLVSKAGATRYYTECTLLYEFKLIRQACS